MALNYYRNKKTKEVIQSLVIKCGKEWELLLIPPEMKLMVVANLGEGTSKLRDHKKQLKERARNHSRDVDLDDNIQVNLANGMEAQVATAFLNGKGQRRRKIDDL